MPKVKNALRLPALSGRNLIALHAEEGKNRRFFLYEGKIGRYKRSRRTRIGDIA